MKWQKLGTSLEQAADVMMKFHQTCTKPGYLLYVSWIQTPEGVINIFVEERGGHTTHLRTWEDGGGIKTTAMYESSRIDVLENDYGLVRMQTD